MSIPSSLEESAQIDGASYVRVLRSVVLPLSMPVLATLTLFYAVGRWNGFQDALIYIRTPILYPIQLILYQIFMSVSDAEIIREGAMVGQGQNEILVAESVKAASIIVATVPIVILYPLLQRHFISGVRLGAVKE
jgi:putative aldouronate transport system permease protein